MKQCVSDMKRTKKTWVYRIYIYVHPHEACGLELYYTGALWLGLVIPWSDFALLAWFHTVVLGRYTGYDVFPTRLL